VGDKDDRKRRTNYLVEAIGFYDGLSFVPSVVRQFFKLDNLSQELDLGSKTVLTPRGKLLSSEIVFTVIALFFLSCVHIWFLCPKDPRSTILMFLARGEHSAFLKQSACAALHVRVQTLRDV
jgi:hypothetical protein